MRLTNSSSTNWSYKKSVRSLYFALENRADLCVRGHGSVELARLKKKEEWQNANFDIARFEYKCCRVVITLNG